MVGKEDSLLNKYLQLIAFGARLMDETNSFASFSERLGRSSCGTELDAVEVFGIM